MGSRRTECSRLALPAPGRCAGREGAVLGLRPPALDRLGQQANGDVRNVQLDLPGVARVKRAWSCFHSKGNLPLKQDQDRLTVTLPTLGAADVIVLEH